MNRLVQRLRACHTGDQHWLDVVLVPSLLADSVFVTSEEGEKA